MVLALQCLTAPGRIRSTSPCRGCSSETLQPGTRHRLFWPCWSCSGARFCSLSLLAMPSSLPPVWRHLILAGSPRVVLAQWCSSCVRVPAASADSRGRAVASAEVTPRCATKEAVSSKLRGLWHRHSPLLWFLAVNEGEREALSLSPTCAWSLLLGLEQALLWEAAARCYPTPCSRHASELQSAQVEA